MLAKRAIRAKQFRHDLLQHTGLGLTQRLSYPGISPALMNLVRILALEPRDFTETGLRNLRALNSAPQRTAILPTKSLPDSVGLLHRTLIAEERALGESSGTQILEVDAGGNTKPGGSQEADFEAAAGLEEIVDLSSDLMAQYALFGQVSEHHLLVPIRVERKACVLLRDALQTLYDRYPSNITADLRWLASIDSSISPQRPNRPGGRPFQGSTHDDQTLRRKHIVTCRLGELKLLQHAIHELDHMLEGHLLDAPDEYNGLLRDSCLECTDELERLRQRSS